MSEIIIPVSQKYCLTVEEAAAYFLIGENRLRRMIESNKNADYLLWVGRNVKIKRNKFEKYIDNINNL